MFGQPFALIFGGISIVFRTPQHFLFKMSKERRKHRYSIRLKVVTMIGILAAVGFSTYNPQVDKSVDDVFKGADQAMCEHKR